MSVETIIRNRIEQKEIRLSGNLCRTKEEWLEAGGICHGSLQVAAQEGYYTVRACEKIGKPVSSEELVNCKDFAIFTSCSVANAIYDKDFNLRSPCLPVFYREQHKQNLTGKTCATCRYFIEVNCTHHDGFCRFLSIGDKQYLHHNGEDCACKQYKE